MKKTGKPRSIGVKNWAKQPGCKDDPVFKLDLEKYVIDELHLFLRVTDRLEEGLIHGVVENDEVTLST